MHSNDVQNSIGLETQEDIAGQRFSKRVGLANALSWLAYASLAAALVTWPAMGLLAGPDGYASCLMFLALFTALFLAVRALAELERSLAFARVLTHLANPALPGVDVFGPLCAHLRRRFGATRCLLLLESQSDEECRLFSSVEGSPVAQRRVTHSSANALLTLPGDAILSYSAKPWRATLDDLRALDSKLSVSEHLKAAREIAQLIEAHQYVCIPLRSGARTVGRIFLVRHFGLFSIPDVTSLQPDLAQLAIVLGNLDLQGRLQRVAARRQRERLARDLHDGPVQSQVGVKLGLEALVRKLGADHPLHEDARELMRVTQEGLVDLRAHIDVLRKPDSTELELPVMPEIQRQVRRFTSLHGIEVKVIGMDVGFKARSDVCEQIGQIVREGLCNIGRHTRSPTALVDVAADTAGIRIEILNEVDPSQSRPPNFRPRTLSERTAELGGSVDISNRFGRYTVVSVNVPL